MHSVQSQGLGMYKERGEESPVEAEINGGVKEVTRITW